MYVIRAKNVNDGWWKAKRLLESSHVSRPSRVGDVWEAYEPVTTVFENPDERVLFDAKRNCNPYFHLFESLWMLAGRNDLDWVAQFNKRMSEFSDDGETLHGAYGYRWRRWFDLEGGAEESFPDQLMKIVRMLRHNHNERRAVLCMWDPRADLDRPELKDIPCNISVAFKVRNGRLSMTVFNRSNDIVWGTFGANAVHMSMMMEYVAAGVGVPLGGYYQVSDSFHAYTERWSQFVDYEEGSPSDPYKTIRPFPLVSDFNSWDDDLVLWMDRTCDDLKAYGNDFFPFVAEPLWLSYQAYAASFFMRMQGEQGEAELQAAFGFARSCRAEDWRHACVRWLERIRIGREGK